MKCKKCGTSNLEDANYCRHCGESLSRWKHVYTWALIGSCLIIAMCVFILTLVASLNSEPKSINMFGHVGNYPVTMCLNMARDSVEGWYYYDTKGPDHKLKLFGTITGNEIELYEYDENNKNTGRFKGLLYEKSFQGTFHNIKRNSDYRFVVTK